MQPDDDPQNVWLQLAAMRKERDAYKQRLANCERALALVSTELERRMTPPRVRWEDDDDAA